MSAKRKSPWRMAVIISMVFFVTPLLVGVVPTIVEMVRSFRAIATGGSSSPVAVTGELSVQLSTAGVVVSIIAGIALAVSVVGLILERRRAKLTASQTA